MLPILEKKKKNISVSSAVSLIKIYILCASVHVEIHSQAVISRQNKNVQKKTGDTTFIYSEKAASPFPVRFMSPQEKPESVDLGTKLLPCHDAGSVISMISLFVLISPP